MRVLFVTGADSNYFSFVQGTILSLRSRTTQFSESAIAFLDLGCSPDQLGWLQQHVDLVTQPVWMFDFPQREQAPSYLRGLFVRPFLRQIFRDVDVYVWIDADAWVQTEEALNLLVEGALRRGMSVVTENDRGYMLPYGNWQWYWKYAHSDYLKVFGAKIADQFCSFPTINAGVFAIRSNAPHWEVWGRWLKQGAQQHAGLMTDQIALNLSIYSELFRHTELLPAYCNWSCNFGFPRWDETRQLFVEPYLPHHSIGILHLTGAKQHEVKLESTTGSPLRMNLRFPMERNSLKTGEIPTSESEKVREPSTTIEFPPGDYVSPGLARIRPDAAFPNMRLGDPSNHPWKYVRRHIPHNWYVDAREPNTGFLSRDEAHILYNAALPFRGMKALEIGCWMGWSAVHLALAGVELDIVDPILGQPTAVKSISQSLRNALELFHRRAVIHFHAGTSPGAVHAIVDRTQRRWSILFIDGDHVSPGPRLDAEACLPYCEPDSMVLFHDLAAPDVAEGLAIFRDEGWNTMVYHTMQIMGVAWRGNVNPPAHQPDPNIPWVLPDHLSGYRVSGLA